MKLADLLKQKADMTLPRRHQLALMGLVAGLLSLMLITGNPEAGRHVNDNTGTNQLSAESGNPGNTPRPPVGPATDSDPRLILDVENGDNLSLLFGRAGLGPGDVQALSANRAPGEELAELYPGYRLAFSIAADNTLAALEIIKSPLESFLYTRDDSGSYQFSHLVKEPVIELVQKEAIITDSLFQAAQRGGIPDAMAMDLAAIFGGVVDFILDTRDGDSFSLVYEERYLDGNFIGTGRILAARFTNQGELHTAVRYENEHGEANFFNLEGESMRKAFLLNPVDFTRISSGFSLSRKHPLLNTIRAHKGTDYAAPTGTPVVATADGRITFANRRGSFGKLVVIQHTDRFETRYAHLSDYARGISNGVRVKQGQVVGYVGTTGSATGPHLHYEFLMDGVQQNSRTIHDQLPKATSIAASELPSFRQQTQGLLALLNGKGKQGNAIARNSYAAPEQ